MSEQVLSLAESREEDFGPEGIRYVRAWKRRLDDKMQNDVLSFWSELNALPVGVDPQERLKEVSILVYDGDLLVGVGTSHVQQLQSLRRLFAFSRSMILPSHRARRLTDKMATTRYNDICEWAEEHPEAGIAGIGAIYQNKKLGKHPVEPSGLTLVGYTPSGDQIRINWFRHIILHNNS